MAEEKNKPEIAFRAGAVQVSVWKNTITKGDNSFENFTVTMQRGYKDKEGKWQNTNSLNTSDIPKARLALLEAFKHIVCKNEQTSD